MATYPIIKLMNMSPMHIGTGKESYDFSSADLHSDTISAAIASIKASRVCGYDIEKFLHSFRISSAFPFWNNFYFLPKPQGTLNIKVEGKEDHDFRKVLKKTKYIELHLWQQLISGNTITVREQQIQNKFIIPESISSEWTPVCKSQVNQRVTVPRADGQNAEPFFFDWTFYDRRAGLFCLVESDDKSFEEIKDLFEELGLSGIGTDKNTGGGKFEVSTDSITITSPSNSNAVTTLSLFIPEKNEMMNLNLDNSKYNLLHRGGYMSGSSIERFRHLRKKSVYMFDVGSIFVGIHDLSGKIVNLRPEWNDPEIHDVFRSGRPICVPVKLYEL